MFETFINSFKLRNTYKVNTIIYSLKQLPIIKKILPEALYQNKALKVIGTIFSILAEITSIFLGKFLYIAIMIFGMLSMYKENTAENFVHILFFLTIAGAFFNTYMFNPTRDKYYAMFIMRIDAKKYTLTNYLYSIIKVIVGFIPFTIIFGLMSGVNIIICILIPFFVAACKIIVSAYSLYKYKKEGQIINENRPLKYIWILAIVCLILAYGLPFIKIAINQLIFTVFCIITIIAALASTKYIIKFNLYKEMYKKILTIGNINQVADAKKINQENVQKQISVDEKITSNKNGYAYFNDLFIKRHSKILIESIKKTAIVLTVIIVAAIIFVITANNEIKAKINEVIMTTLPWFVFIMYIINRGQYITQAMFMNCDHSMLTYPFYRKPSTILGVFKERIKSTVAINLIPAFILGIGLAIILLVSGGTQNNYNYLIIFTSIVAMSIFFSIHHLVLYYLLQPYNVYSETKSSTFAVANFLTYIVCYFMLKMQLPTTYFGIATIVFAILYCVIALVLSYRLAPKTFKLRI